MIFSSAVLTGLTWRRAWGQVRLIASWLNKWRADLSSHWSSHWSIAAALSSPPVMPNNRVITGVKEAMLWLFVDLCHTCHLIRPPAGSFCPFKDITGGGVKPRGSGMLQMSLPVVGKTFTALCTWLFTGSDERLHSNFFTRDMKFVFALRIICYWLFKYNSLCV